MNKNSVEILAPAGNMESLKAAVENGAGAVYLGLTTLNARRGATNFEADELVGAVNYAHENGVKVFLTLNIDLKDREVGQAFRIVELASQCEVDAILVRDPALLFLPEFYPNMEFHFSTQAACCNSADIEAAKILGIKRVVLARENSLEEIKEISQVNDVETEVFVQGALCFSISGRCQLSSWGGGRSGNRGTCTSPCRVPWGCGEEKVGTGTPFSMHDLSAAERVDELIKAGVDSLKIEGRLKKSEWVADAVSLFKGSVENGEVDSTQAKKLGDYTGRKVVDSFLSGCFTGLTGRSGRVATEEEILEEAPKTVEVETPEESSKVDLNVVLNFSGPRITLEATCGDKTLFREITKSKAGKRAVPVKNIFAEIRGTGFDGVGTINFECDDPEFPVANRFGKTVSTDLAKLVISYVGVKKNKNTKKLKSIRTVLPEPVKELSLRPHSSEENSIKFGKRAKVVRLKAKFIEEFAEQQKSYYIFEDMSVEDLELAVALYSAESFSVALPSIFYNNEIDQLKELVTSASENGVMVEVNSWGGLFLAKQSGCEYEAGPGLAVLNGRAADKLVKLGCKRVCWSLEADHRIFADLTNSTPTSALMYVYGFPVLMQSRVEFPEVTYGKVFKDRRGISIKISRENGLSVFRSAELFSLLGLSNEDIKASNYAWDLTGCETPLEEFEELIGGKIPKNPARFNFDRTLS